MLRTIRYPVSHPVLKYLIKYFWVIESNSIISVSHKLLPVSNIDFIFNLSSPIKYITDKEVRTTSTGFHFNGIRDKHYIINQTGNLRVFGASFFSTGLFPILRIPLDEFTGQTIELDDIIRNFTDEILKKITEVQSNDEIIKVIEIAIADSVDISLIPSKDVYELFRTFNSNNYYIRDFCMQYGVNQRKLERIFNKYIGVSPKLFQRINRFNGIINQIQGKKNDNLALFAYDNNYFDQTHFIKDFKSFTGTTPTEFLSQNNSVRQIMELY